MKTKMLIISRDQKIRCELYAILRDKNTDVYLAESAAETEAYLLKHQYSLIIIDAPNVVLYYTGTENSLEKPASIEEYAVQAHDLLKFRAKSRISTMLPRDTTIVFNGELRIDPQYHTVSIDGSPLILTPKEFDLLFYMAHHPKQVLSRAQLYEQIWKSEPRQGEDATVKAHIASLRKKLRGMGKSYIQNVWGVGYFFMPPEL